MRRSALGAALLFLLSGCVYFNAMYNTKRLAGSARQAERDGRPFEANNLWGQVITRADSLVVRHPGSKYVDEALVYKGIALARLNQCPTAVTPLARASVLELEGEIAEEASLALGRCRLELGDPGSAALAFGRLVESRDAGRRREASVLYARALRQTGRPGEALAALEGVHDPRAPRERLLALAAAGRRDETLALAESLLALGDSAHVWDSVLGAVGPANPPIASALLDRLGRAPSSTPELHARRLLDDAARLESVDSVRALERLREAARLNDKSDYAARARLRLLRRDVEHARSREDLRTLQDSLRPLAALRSEVGQEAQLLAATVAAVGTAADSSVPGVPQGDLRLFLAAEIARDTLRAPALAASFFRQLVETWPDSPYAPKALLAGRVLDPAWGEAMGPLLDERYAASPYLAFVRGHEPLGYRELEDSLQSYALAQSARQVRRRPAADSLILRRRNDPEKLREQTDDAATQRPTTPRPGLEP